MLDQDAHGWNHHRGEPKTTAVVARSHSRGESPVFNGLWRRSNPGPKGAYARDDDGVDLARNNG
jgi:hypothetical protein